VTLADVSTLPSTAGMDLVVVGGPSFRVTDTAGPLVAGEEERAKRWGETIANAV
jgi:hypothetical protein